MNPTGEARGDRIDPDAFGELADRYLLAWNSHDPSQVAACAAPDVTWNSPALHHPGRGRAAVAELVASTARAFPDYEFSRPATWAIAEDERTAYIPWRMTGTHTGRFDPPGYAPSGKPIDLHGIDVVRLRDGLIWHHESVYDYSLVTRQLGLAIARGGRVERLAVRAQRALMAIRHRWHRS